MDDQARHTLYMAERERDIRLKQVQMRDDRTTKTLFGIIGVGLFIAGCVIAIHL